MTRHVRRLDVLKQLCQLYKRIIQSGHEYVHIYLKTPGVTLTFDEGILVLDKTHDVLSNCSIIQYTVKSR